jgi:hypothetical protein
VDGAPSLEMGDLEDEVEAHELRRAALEPLVGGHEAVEQLGPPTDARDLAEDRGAEPEVVRGELHALAPRDDRPEGGDRHVPPVRGVVVEYMRRGPKGQ